MATEPLAPNEGERLQALHNLHILDTPSDPELAEICRTAVQEFEVETALISLIDRDRQWFKERCGFGFPETVREMAFCTYAILTDEPLVVPDARADARFSANPLVTGPPFIRFYAGAPLLIGGGIRLGTLCILDPKPRAPARVDLGRLQQLSRAAARGVMMSARDSSPLRPPAPRQRLAAPIDDIVWG